MLFELSRNSTLLSAVELIRVDKSAKNKPGPNSSDDLLKSSLNNSLDVVRLFAVNNVKPFVSPKLRRVCSRGSFEILRFR